LAISRDEYYNDDFDVGASSILYAAEPAVAADLLERSTTTSTTTSTYGLN